MDCSSVIVNNGVNLHFATDGMAIYAETCTMNKPGNRQCFIRHSNSSLHPNNWGINVTFIVDKIITKPCIQICDKNTTFMGRDGI